jgi:hypothetical protein
VTTTGLILGFFGKNYTLQNSNFLPGTNVSSGLIWLLPLVVLLPAWWIFFDKATTITRVVGYFRILEKLILWKVETNNRNTRVNFVGWESSLAIFRREESAIYKEIYKKPENATENTKKSRPFFFKRINHYWVMIYCIFLFLSLICLVIALFNITWGNLYHIMVIIFAGVIIVFSIVCNILTLWRLCEGKYSYNSNEKIWERILLP